MGPAFSEPQRGLHAPLRPGPALPHGGWSALAVQLQHDFTPEHAAGQKSQRQGVSRYLVPPGSHCPRCWADGGPDSRGSRSTGRWRARSRRWTRACVRTVSPPSARRLPGSGAVTATLRATAGRAAGSLGPRSLTHFSTDRSRCRVPGTLLGAGVQQGMGGHTRFSGRACILMGEGTHVHTHTHTHE